MWYQDLNVTSKAVSQHSLGSFIFCVGGGVVVDGAAVGGNGGGVGRSFVWANGIVVISFAALLSSFSFLAYFV